jgi:hypothetical protein
MSLKAFHVVFVAASTLLAFGFAAWAMRHYFSGEGSAADMALGIASFVFGVALVFYGRYVLRKLKNMSYL